jgi:hypothetical protein
MRIYSDKAIDAKLAGYRMYLTELLADAVDGLTPGDCNHRNGGTAEKCTRCAQRIAITAAATKVREIGGVAS